MRARIFRRVALAAVLLPSALLAGIVPVPLDLIPGPTYYAYPEVKKVTATSGYGYRTKAKRQKKDGSGNIVITTSDPSTGKTTTVTVPPGNTVVVSPGGTVTIKPQLTVKGSISTAPLPHDTAATTIAEDDFNGDGIVDVAAASTGSNMLEVYFMGADGTLSQPAQYAVGSEPLSVITADFNHDNQPDLAVTNIGDNTVSVLLGKSDGTFQPAVSYPAGVAPWSLATADFNGDGIPDLVVADCGDPGCSGQENTGTISFLAGQGGGKFAAPVTIAQGGAPVTIIAADLNGDDRPDIAYGSFGSGSISVLLSTGPGTFGAPVPWSAGAMPYFLGYGDFNGDGKMDLASMAPDTSTLSVLLGAGAGSFAPPVMYVGGNQALDFSFVDLAGNGGIDILALDSVDQTIVAMPGLGDGTFDAPHVFPAVSKPNLVAAGDFNGDGKPDFTVSMSSTLGVYLNAGGLAFQAPASLSLSGNPVALANADFNKDGKADLAVALGNGVTIYEGSAQGLGSTSVSIPQTSGTVSALAAGDVDGDGNPDLVVATSNPGMISVLLGDGKGGFHPSQTISAGINPVGVAIADLNGDNKQDLAICDNGGGQGSSQSGGVFVILNNGGGKFASAVSYPAGAFPVGLTVADFSSDGIPDVAVATNVIGPNGLLTSANLALLPGQGNGVLAAPAFGTIDTGPVAIATTDINSDGVPDLLITNCCGLVDVDLLLGNGDGSFLEIKVAAGDFLKGIAVADFNGDKKPDLLVASQGTNAGANLHGFASVLFNQPYQGPPATTVNGAKFAAGPTAPASIVSTFGTDLATASGATQVNLVDSAGSIFAAQVFSGGPNQVNLQIPPAAQAGPGTLLFTSGDGGQSQSAVTLSRVAPGIFTEPGTNSLAAAGILRVHADQSQTPGLAIQCSGQTACSPLPITLDPPTDQVYLILYGTGLRAAPESQVSVTVGGMSLTPYYSGAQGTFLGLDQIDLLLPGSLKGSGDVVVQVTAAGLPANPVHITIQ